MLKRNLRSPPAQNILRMVAVIVTSSFYILHTLQSIIHQIRGNKMELGKALSCESIRRGEPFEQPGWTMEDNELVGIMEQRS